MATGEETPKKGRWDRSDDLRVRLSAEEYEVYNGLFLTIDKEFGPEPAPFTPTTIQYYDLDQDNIFGVLTGKWQGPPIKRRYTVPPDDLFRLACLMYPELSVNFCLANEHPVVVEPLFLVRGKRPKMLPPHPRGTVRPEGAGLEWRNRWTVSRAGFSGNHQIAMVDVHYEMIDWHKGFYYLLEPRDGQWRLLSERRSMFRI